MIIGSYEICTSNKVSRMHSKVVSLDIQIRKYDNETGPQSEVDDPFMQPEQPQTESPEVESYANMLVKSFSGIFFVTNWFLVGYEI